MAKTVSGYITQDCNGDYSQKHEEKRDFDGNWETPHDYNRSKILQREMPWRYQRDSNLDSYATKALYSSYGGGGYIVEIFPKWNNSRILDNLKQKKWLDHHTRALIIEFAVFNPATNYFDAVNIFLEQPATGGVVHYYLVTTFKLFRYTSSIAFFELVAEICFLLFTILFLFREIKIFRKEKWSYFKGFWNLIEFFNLVLSIVAIAVYIYRDYLAKRLMLRLPKKRPQNYINFYFAAQVDLLLTYMVALICFCVTVKFIKLLRFNKRVSMLSSTLKKAWYPMSMFGMLFGIVLIACTCFSVLAFGNNLFHYRNAFSAFASIISLLLGKFSYYQFENTNPVLGPAFFFGFNTFVNWIVMNMYISIMDDSIGEVREDIVSSNHEYQIVDYAMDQFKGVYFFSSLLV